jgi:hypothetical protein
MEAPLRRAIKRLIAVASLSILVMVPWQYSQTLSPHPVPSFASGQTFLGWSENQRIIYTMGLMDGFATGAVLTDDSWRLYQRELPPQCVSAMSSGQMAAIIEKYLGENPEQWDKSMSTIGWNAMQRACKLR